MYDFMKLEATRKKCASQVVLGFIIAALGVILFIGVSDFPFIGVIVGIVGLILLIAGYLRFAKLAHDFKNKYLPQLIEEILPGAKYSLKGGIPQQDVYNCGFLKKADRFTTGDLITGQIDGVDFSTCDLKLEERHVRRTKNGTHVYYVAYFTGRFFEFDFPKDFIGKVIISEQSLITWFTGLKKIEMESIDFNKKFSTYTNNEHSAFYILTPHFMESVLELERNNPGSIALSFHGNKLNIGLNNSKDTFELSIFKEINQELVNEYKRDLLVIKDIVLELKLNRNIFK